VKRLGPFTLEGEMKLHLIRTGWVGAVVGDRKLTPEFLATLGVKGDDAFRDLGRVRVTIEPLDEPTP
jgi:hypothetical protein